MTKIFLIFSILFIFQSKSFSQFEIIPLSELISISNYNFNEFDTYMLKKGFEFTANTKKPGYNAKMYMRYDKSTNGLNTQTCGLRIKNDGLTNIIYTFHNQEWYLTIKEQIAELGFEYRGISNDHSNTFVYIKNKIEVDLVTELKIQSDGRTSREYTVFVYNF